MKVGIKVKFWGVRGSIPTPGVKYVKYGGNTPCVEVLLPNNQLFIFDAGTGIRELGNTLCKGRKKHKIHVFLSHFHWDHIQGLPFFMPSYIKGNNIVVLGMDLEGARLDKIISNQMESIYFPIKLHTLAANFQFQILAEGSNDIEGTRVDAIYINHPGQAMGYVVNFEKVKICYLSDNELVPLWAAKYSETAYRSNTREKILKLISGADLLIHDAQYTDEEYKTKVGWGHSPFGEVMRLAKDGRVKKLALFHHDPDHFDEHIDVLVADCDCKENPSRFSHVMECFAAHEGMELHF
ncbi:MAG: MBL fold metallo-hydrolase [Planctomycetota bacterium]|nr:MBL fold metallo-hydrolase [Planctomycetota bacterium]